MSRFEKRDLLEVFAVTAAMVPLTMVTAVIVYSFVAAVRGVSFAELEKNGAQLIALGVGANAIAFAAVPMLLARHRVTARRAHERLALRSSSWIDHAIAVLGLLGLTTALDALVQLVGLGDYGRLAEMRESLVSLSFRERLPLAFVLAVGAGIPEELFFRGYVLHRLATSAGQTAAMLISSLLFGIFHLDPLHAPLAAAMGVFLGFVVLRTGSIYPAITAHAINNAFAAMTSGLELDAFYLWPSLIVGTAAIFCAFVLIVRRHRDAERVIVW